MSKDFKKVERLAQQWLAEQDEMRVVDIPDSREFVRILDIGGGPIARQGNVILQMLEELREEHPEDMDIRHEQCLQLARMGQLYFDALSPILLCVTKDEFMDLDFDDDDHFKLLMNARFQAPTYASEACSYFFLSVNVLPFYASAYHLAELFRFVGFHGTALYWYSLAMDWATQQNREETASKAKAHLSRLREAGKTTDPLLSSLDKGDHLHTFPTENTPGLQLKLQDAALQADELAQRQREHAEQDRKRVEEEQRQQKADEEKRKQMEAAEAAYKQREELDRQQQEKQDRIAQGLCVCCGRALGLMEKALRRQAHNSCSP